MNFHYLFIYFLFVSFFIISLLAAEQCSMHGELYDHDTRIYPRPCAVCTCNDGSFTCNISRVEEVCPPLPCPLEQQISVADECCKFCPGTLKRYIIFPFFLTFLSTFYMIFAFYIYKDNITIKELRKTSCINLQTNNSSA